MKTTLLFAGIFLAGILLLELVTAQNCCKSGPCSKPPPTNNANIPGIVTPAFFNKIVAKAGNKCPGKGFYTRSAFLKAIKAYPRFAKSGSIADSKREIAAFFAQITHETGWFIGILLLARGLALQSGTSMGGEGECNGGAPNAVSARVRYYTNYCNQLGVKPGTNLRC
ncbi:hypothetical protein OSB04_011393 [Centaurea solstitialis]|uniref:Glycoside hydrolase family 19 catalytic domain-containing protein n=1 Tax=Centaurea solstitialis TaxID=347529 RepID=A0AA38TB24_9ASTR|nr:hypothetical protein OSB04_011393 [Centaurea solstitialis]